MVQRISLGVSVKKMEAVDICDKAKKFTVLVECCSNYSNFIVKSSALRRVAH